MIRNAQIYRLPAPWAIDREQLAEQLARKVLQAPGALDHETRGWVSPTGDDVLVHAVGGHWLIALGIERRLLPTSVVNDVVAERAEELEQQQGYRLGRQQMKDLREQVTRELLPQAFVLTRRTTAWIDPVGGWLVVDASSPARAEDVIEHLRQSLDSFPLKLLRTTNSPTSAMAGWLAGDEPTGFTIDRDCELRSVGEDRAKVRYTHHTLDGDEVKGHLEAGKLPTLLAMTFDDRVSFLLTEKLEIKRIELLDVVTEQLAQDALDARDAAAVRDAEIALMTGELSRLIPALVTELGGELAELEV